MRTLLTTVCFFLISAHLSLGFRHGPVFAEEPVFDLRTDEGVDEQLYLARRLEMLHAVFASETSDPDALAKQLLATRYEMARIKEFAELKFMDDRLVQLYSDSLALLDQYSKLMIDVGAIDRHYERQLSERSVSGVARAMTESAQAGGGLAVAGADPYTAGLVIAGLMVEEGISAHHERKSLLEERDATKLSRMHEFDVERSRLLGRIQVQVGILAEKHKWAPAEAGFDATNEEVERFRNAVHREDLPAIRGYLEAARAVRPRDPFLFASLAELQFIEFSLATDEDGDTARLSHLKHAVENQIRAAELVPADRFHDPMRAEYLLQASMYASTAAYFAAKRSNFPLRLANAALHYQPRDPGGRIRWYRAVALHRNHDYVGAIQAFEQIGQLDGKDAGHHFDLACLLSSANRPDDAMRHLQLAWTAGRRNPREIRQHRDLATLRQKFQQDVDTLVAPKWAGILDYGYLWNDCVVENKSEFTLNNVIARLTCTISNGEKFVEVYWADTLPPASTHTVSSCFDAVADDPGNRVVTEILCDENRFVQPTPISEAVGTYEGQVTLVRSDGEYAYNSDEQRLTIVREVNGTLTARFAAEGGESQLAIGPIRDSCAVLVIDGESTSRGRICFSGAVVYGWYLSPAQNSRKFVFWFER